VVSSISSSSINSRERRESREGRDSRTSNPASPTKETNRKTFLGKVTALSSLSQVVTAKANEAKERADSYRSGSINPNKCLTLLIIDGATTDWSIYFRGRKVRDLDIRVVQAEFSELTVIASSSDGVVVGVTNTGRGGKTVSPFKPDFLMIRQNLRDAGEDYRNTLLGFQFGGVPCINSLESIYNFQDKPWVHSHLLDIQRRLGKEAFPLIGQTYYPDHRDMDTMTSPPFPCVVKVGHAHGGLGKVKVESETNYKDLAGVVAVSGQYCTVEEYVDAKYQLHVFKLGPHYRALTVSHCCDCRRKSLSENWKTKLGQATMEEVRVEERYKYWIDQVSEMFGGLDLCSLEAVVAKDGQEVIIEVNDCALSLMGDNQEEDRNYIADLVLSRMETRCHSSEELLVTNGHSSDISIPAPENGKKKILPGPIQRGRNPSTSSTTSEVSTVSSITVRKGEEEESIPQESRPAEGEDTMKNLRTTFSSIFGEIK